MRLSLAGTALDLAGVEPGAAHYNYAVGCLEAYLRRHAPEVQVTQHQFRIEPGGTALPPDTAETILATDPEVVGLSTYCWDMDAFAAVAADIRSLAPSVKIVAGGPGVTYDPLGVMSDVSAFDFAVVGEGEHTLLRLLRSLDDPCRVPGLLWRDGVGVSASGEPGPPVPLTELPSAYLAGTLDPPRDHVALEASRGCGKRCTHCAWRAFAGGLRHADMRRLADELRWAVARGHRHGMFLDSALNFQTDRLQALTNTVAEAAPNREMSFMYFLHEERIETAQLRALEKMESHSIWVGFESSNRDALRALKRPKADPARFVRNLDDLSTLGPVQVTMMLGIPSDTLDGFRESFEYVASLVEGPQGRRISGIRLFWTVVPRGSQMALDPSFRPVTADKGVPYLLESSTFSRADMAEALRFVADHPAAPLVVWTDAPPSLHFPELADVRLGRSVHVPGPSLDDREPDAELSVEQLEALSSSCRAGAVFDGWTVTRRRVHDGWPHVVVERAGRELEIRIEGYREGDRYFVRGGRFALSWRTERSSGHQLDESAIRAIRRIAAELAAS